MQEIASPIQLTCVGTWKGSHAITSVAKSGCMCLACLESADELYGGTPSNLKADAGGQPWCVDFALPHRLAPIHGPKDVFLNLARGRSTAA